MVVSVSVAFKSQNDDIGHFVDIFVKKCDISLVEQLNDGEDIDLEGYDISLCSKSGNLVVKNEKTKFSVNFNQLIEISKNLMNLNGLCHSLKTEVLEEFPGIERIVAEEEDDDIQSPETDNELGQAVAKLNDFNLGDNFEKIELRASTPPAVTSPSNLLTEIKFLYSGLNDGTLINSSKSAPRSGTDPFPQPALNITPNKPSSSSNHAPTGAHKEDIATSSGASKSTDKMYEYQTEDKNGILEIRRKVKKSNLPIDINNLNDAGGMADSSHISMLEEKAKAFDFKNCKSIETGSQTAFCSQYNITTSEGNEYIFHSDGHFRNKKSAKSSAAKLAYTYLFIDYPLDDKRKNLKQNKESSINYRGKLNLFYQQKLKLSPPVFEDKTESISNKMLFGVKVTYEFTDGTHELTVDCKHTTKKQAYQDAAKQVFEIVSNNMKENGN